MSDRPIAGFECALFYKDGANWNEIKNAKDVSLPDSTEAIDVSARYSAAKKYIAGMSDGSIEFGYQYIKGTEPVFDALQAFDPITTTLQINGIGAPLSPDASVQVLHIVQESLSNIRKHARAHTVSICLEQSVPGVELTIRDDGVGFDPINDLAVNSDNHVGLKIMKERCQRIGGTLTIHSAPQHGTQVVLTLPGLHGAAS